MKLPDLFVSAVTTFDGKALAKGQKQIGGFEKSVNSLGKTFAATFGAAAMLSYGKNSLKAFAENEKSAKRLQVVLKNLGLSFDNSAIEKNLDNISAKFGYQGEVLREAFQALITVTGSTTKAQDLLNLSLDIAAGSGEDLLTVNQDLAAVYVGNTKGLGKYNLGLTKSELKTLGFQEAVDKLTSTFAGAGQAELETYSGKMRVLNEAAGAAQETIGGALIDAFMKLAGDTTVEDLTDSVDNLADSLAAVIQLTGGVAAPFVGLAKLFNDASSAYVKLLYKVTGTAFFGNVSDRQYGGAAADKYRAIEEAANAKKRAAAEAAAVKRQKELLALQKKSAAAALAAAKAKKLGLAIDKANLTLGKGGNVFDIEAIQLEAAKISQVEQLKKVTNVAQLLAIKNDLARLEVLRSMKALEDAIATGDIVKITQATERLNKDITILANLTKQEAKLTEIKDILSKLNPKDLINITNLNDAIDLLKKLIVPSGGTIDIKISDATAAALTAAIAAAAAAGTAATNAAAVAAQITKDAAGTLAKVSDITSTFGSKNILTSIVTATSIAAAISGRLNTAISGPSDPRVLYGGQRIDGNGDAIGYNAEMAYAMSAKGMAETKAAIEAANKAGLTVNNNFNGIVGDSNALANLIAKIVQDALDRGTIKASTIP